MTNTGNGIADHTDLARHLAPRREHPACRCGHSHAEHCTPRLRFVMPCSTCGCCKYEPFVEETA